jgi:hypothetical protein
MKRGYDYALHKNLVDTILTLKDTLEGKQYYVSDLASHDDENFNEEIKSLLEMAFDLVSEIDKPGSIRTLL